MRKNSNVVYDFLQNQLHEGNIILVKVTYKLKGKCTIKDIKLFLDNSFTFTFQQIASVCRPLSKEVLFISDTSVSLVLIFMIGVFLMNRKKNLHKKLLR